MTDKKGVYAFDPELRERIWGRLWQFAGLLTILVIGVGASVWQNVATIYIIAGIAAWVVFSLHLSLTGIVVIVEQMYELNDQITGHKDEFRRLLHERRSKPVS